MYLVKIIIRLIDGDQVYVVSFIMTTHRTQEYICELLAQSNKTIHKVNQNNREPGQNSTESYNQKIINILVFK